MTSRVVRTLQAAQGSPALWDQQCNGERTATLSFLYFFFWANKEKVQINKNFIFISSTFAYLYALFLRVFIPFRVQKKKQEKGTPAVPALQASLRFSVLTGRGKPPRLWRVQTCQRPFSSTPAMLSGTEWGPQKTKHRKFKSHVTLPVTH